jgi:hypothetical protein
VRCLSPEQSGPEPSDPWVPADVLLREEPENEEEDEQEHEGAAKMTMETKATRSERDLRLED